MMKQTTKSQANKLLNYLLAKDQNKPHLMKEAFTASATLKMEVKTENISFPSTAVGLEEITDVLIKKFSATYENIYTFCLSDSVASNDDNLSCNWLVAMSDKANGNVRVGCGEYHWHFDNEANGLADALIITIEQMLVLTPESADQVLGWVSKLPYPWCESATMFQTMPPLDALTPIKEQMTS